MSRPTPSIDAAARFLADDLDPVDFVPGDGSRPPLLRRRKCPTDVLELRGASKPELDAIQIGMVAMHNGIAAHMASKRAMNRPRVQNCELLLARVRMYGFELVRECEEVVEVRRDGRVSTIDLAAVQYTARDPRDAWLLSFALEDDTRWSPREFYVAYRPEDGEPLPAQLVLEPGEDASAPLVLRHSIFGSEGERTPLRSIEQLRDALPFLAPPNAVGYHRARERIIARYERLRPKTWADVGVTDPGAIAEYERHRVGPDDVARAAESGIVGLDAVITAFGVPAEDEWTSAHPEQRIVHAAVDREKLVFAVAAYIAGLAPLVDLRTLTTGLHGFDFAVTVPQNEKAEVLPRLADVTMDVEDRYGMQFRTLAVAGPSRRP